MSAFAGEEVDGEVDDGDQCAKGSGHAFQALHRLFVVLHTTLQLAEAAWLSNAYDLPHLALQDIQIGQYLSFKVGHNL